MKGSGVARLELGKWGGSFVLGRSPVSVSQIIAVHVAPLMSWLGCMFRRCHHSQICPKHGMVKKSYGCCSIRYCFCLHKSASSLLLLLQALPPQPNTRPKRERSAESFVSPLDRAAHSDDSSSALDHTNASESATGFNFYQVCTAPRLLLL